MQYSHLEGINVGSGQHYAKGWLNIDVIPTDKGQQPDLLADIYEFPFLFDQHEFKKAYVGHVLEHIPWDMLDIAIGCIAYAAKHVMVVGPCITKAESTNQPTDLIDGIRAPENPDAHPWGHKWTPTEELTAQAIRNAGYEPHIIPIAEVRRPEWPNPSTAAWQTAMWFTA